MDKYSTDLLSLATELDKYLNNNGETTQYAMMLIQENSKQYSLKLIKKINQITQSGLYSNDVIKSAAALKDGLVRYHGYKTVVAICNSETTEQEDEKSFEQLMDELNSLVGLDSVKKKVNDLIRYQKIQQLRRDNNLHATKGTMHLAFLGNPGTGKTTVARIVGRLYKKLGLLSSGHFLEVSRTDLIAGYQGQTALKVKDIIEKSKGGVLFIDEAYSITENEHSDSYGRECLTELTKALEDYRDDLVVIVAGYTQPMNVFFDSNPGLKSRFNTFILFEDYNAHELETIIEKMCKDNDYVLSDDVKIEMINYFSEIIVKEQENFSNGRLARNMYEDLIMNHARRVFEINNPTKEDLSIITVNDFQFE